MTKIAIVGSSKLTPVEIDKARNIIESIFNSHEPAQFITGDARGIDSLVLSYSPTHDITMVKAIEHKWNGRYGFKTRNIRIAEEADYIYSIATVKKNTPCYHCNIKDHERTGGCWTKKYAWNELGKKGQTIIIK